MGALSTWCSVLALFIFFINIATNFFSQNFTLTAINIESAAAMTLRFRGACRVVFRVLPDNFT